MKRFLSLLVIVITLFAFLSLGVYVYNNYYVVTLVLYVMSIFAFEKYRKYLLNQIDYTFSEEGMKSLTKKEQQFLKKNK